MYFFSSRFYSLAVISFVVACLALLTEGQAAEPAGEEVAFLVVRLPVSARLLIASTPTRLTGTERVFETPPLPRGQTFTYKMTAIWTENGKERTDERTAEVRAGATTRIDFNQPASNVPSKPMPPSASPPPDPVTKPKPAIETPPIPVPPAKKPQPTTEPNSDRREPDPPAARMREFRFTYVTTLTGLPKDSTARVWLPVAQTNEDQRVQIVAKDAPANAQLTHEPEYGNQMLYTEVKPGGDGSVRLSVTYLVRRQEVKGDPNRASSDDNSVARFLQPDAKVPVGGKPLKLLTGKEVPEDSLAAARLFYDVVNSHMTYSKKGEGWGQGDAEWACDSRFGNCSDFHSLFIALARARKIPAKFEIGFPLPAKRGSGEIPGYHCWAKFRAPGGGWIPVDISEANKDPKMTDYYFGNLTEDRITFTVGRDLSLEPKQAGPPLNFFIYPYVEVDGKPLAKDRIKNNFTFEDK